MSATSLRVLVTGARTYYALPVIRALGRLGHRVTAADSDTHAAGFYSRYTTARFVHPRVDTESELFVASIAELLRRDPHDIVLPLYEEALPLARHATALPESVRLPLADYACMMSLHDKQRLYALASRQGVPIPATRTVSGALPAGISFPAVVKVGQSSSARGVAVVHSPEEFHAAWSQLRASHQLPPSVPAILQRFIAGPQLCTLSFAWHGEPKGTLVYRNVCEFPPNGGAGIVRESVRHEAVVRDVERLIRGSGFHGVIGFDFLLDDDGTPLLTDANPRPTPGILLAQKCGIDIVGMMLAATEPPAAPPARIGLRTRFDPLVAVWMLRSLLPQPHGWKRFATAVSLLVPKRRSTSDLFDRGDLRSLRALPIAAIDALRARRRGGRLLDTVATSQYRDYT